MRYTEVEAEYPELETIWPKFSAEWYERYRVLHLAKYPDLDQGTKDNLAMFVERAREREQTVGQGVLPL